MADQTQGPPSVAEFDSAPATPSIAEFDAAPSAEAFDATPPSDPFVNAPSVSGSPSALAGGTSASSLRPDAKGLYNTEDEFGDVVLGQGPDMDELRQAAQSLPQPGTVVNPAQQQADAYRARTKELADALVAGVSQDMPFSSIMPGKEIPTFLPHGPKTIAVDPREEHMAQAYSDWLKVAEPGVAATIERKLQPGDKWQEALNGLSERDKMEWRLGMLNHQANAFKAFVDKAGGMDKLSPSGQKERVGRSTRNFV